MNKPWWDSQVAGVDMTDDELMSWLRSYTSRVVVVPADEPTLERVEEIVQEIATRSGQNPEAVRQYIRMTSQTIGAAAFIRHI